MKPTLSQIQLALLAGAPDKSAEGLRALSERLGVFNPVVKQGKPRTGRNKQPEQLLQEAVCRYLDTQPRILYWANNPQIITGKMTNAKLGYLAKLKKRGFKKGVPDLCLAFKTHQGIPVFLAIELKSENGVVSDEQELFIEMLSERGSHAGVARSIDDVQMLLKRYGY